MVTIQSMHVLKGALIRGGITEKDIRKAEKSLFKFPQIKKIHQ